MLENILAPLLAALAFLCIGGAMGVRFGGQRGIWIAIALTGAIGAVLGVVGVMG